MTTPARVRQVIEAAVDALRREGVVCWLEDYHEAGKLTVEIYYEREEQEPVPPKRPLGRPPGVRVKPKE